MPFFLISSCDNIRPRPLMYYWFAVCSNVWSDENEATVLFQKCWIASSWLELLPHVKSWDLVHEWGWDGAGDRQWWGHWLTLRGQSEEPGLWLMLRLWSCWIKLVLERSNEASFKNNTEGKREESGMCSESWEIIGFSETFYQQQRVTRQHKATKHD